MQHQRYFPRAISKQRSWAQSYRERIAVQGLALGMSVAEISAEQALCDAITGAIDIAYMAKREAKAQNKNKDRIVRDSMDIFRLKIKAHKVNPAYTEAMGKSLGIIGSELNFDPLKVKTIVILTKTPEGISIKFNLENCEGGNVYCKRGKDADFVFLKHVNHPQMVDKRPNEDNSDSEHREYFVVLVENDNEIGIPSDAAVINN